MLWHKCLVCSHLLLRAINGVVDLLNLYLESSFGTISIELLIVSGKAWLNMRAVQKTKILLWVCHFLLLWIRLTGRTVIIAQFFHQMLFYCWIHLMLALSVITEILLHHVRGKKRGKNGLGSQCAVQPELFWPASCKLTELCCIWMVTALAGIPTPRSCIRSCAVAVVLLSQISISDLSYQKTNPGWSRESWCSRLQLDCVLFQSCCLYTRKQSLSWMLFAALCWVNTNERALKGWTELDMWHFRWLGQVVGLSSKKLFSLKYLKLAISLRMMRGLWECLDISEYLYADISLGFFLFLKEIKRQAI